MNVLIRKVSFCSKILASVLFVLFCTIMTRAQNNVGINTETPDNSAILDVSSSDKGMLVPRLTDVQRDAIVNPANGLLVYCTTDSKFYFFNGGEWARIGQDDFGKHIASENIQLQGNWISGDGDHEGIFVNNAGHVGIGTNGPNSLLQVFTNGDVEEGNHTGNVAIFGSSFGKNLTIDNNEIQTRDNGSVSTLLLNQDGHIITNTSGGNFGIGVPSPTAKLHVVGGFRLQDNNEGVGKVLLSDASGLATWSPASSVADNLGNHTATNNLQMNGNWISQDGDPEGILVSSSGHAIIKKNSSGYNLTLDDPSAAVGTASQQLIMQTGSSNVRHRIAGGSHELYQVGASGGNISKMVFGPTALFQYPMFVTDDNQLGLNMNTGNIGSTYRFQINNNKTGADSSLYFTKNGWLGIGENTPSERLDVIEDIEVANVKIGRGNGSNTSSNTRVGWQALEANTTAFNNTAVGYYALAATSTGGYNTAVGTEALRFNTVGFFNTAVGRHSLLNNTDGTHNTAMGYGALISNTSGVNNIGIGASVLGDNTTGDENIAIGGLKNNLVGNRNTAVGFASLSSNEGSFNIGIGAVAGYDIVNANNNVMIGYNTGRGVVSGGGNTIIGASLVGFHPSLNSSVVIGSANKTRIFIDSIGNAAFGNSTPTEKLEVTAASNTSLKISNSNALTHGRLSSVVDDWTGLNHNMDYISGDQYKRDDASKPAWGLKLDGRVAYDAFEIWRFEPSTGNHTHTANDILFKIDGTGNIGIGTEAPTEKLEVNGSIKMTDGSEGIGKVLVSDVNGVATWSSAPLLQDVFVTKSDDYSVLSEDQIVYADATSNAIVLTLPSAALNTGKRYHIKKVDLTNNSISIETFGGETIDGATNQSTNVPFSGYVLSSNGVNWMIIGRI